MIYVLGVNGMLGRYVYDYLKYKKHYPVIGLTRSSLNASDINGSRKFLEQTITVNDIVINCMGVTNKRTDVSDKDMYIVNSIFPHLVDRICYQKCAKFIHASTDCVFTGDIHTGPLTHNSVRDELSPYGFSKSIGENLYGCVIRTSIIGEEENNKRNLIEWCKSMKGNVIDGYTDHLWNGITCLEWAKITDKIIQNITRSFPAGLNVFQSKHKNKDFVTKYELISLINKIYDLQIIINRCNTGNVVNKALRGTKTILDLEDQIIELRNYNFFYNNYPGFKYNPNHDIEGIMFQTNNIPKNILLSITDFTSRTDIAEIFYSYTYQTVNNVTQALIYYDNHRLPEPFEKLWKYMNHPIFIENIGTNNIKSDELRTTTKLLKMSARPFAMKYTPTKLTILLIFAETEGGDLNVTYDQGHPTKIPIVNNMMVVIPRLFRGISIDKDQPDVIIFSVSYL